MPTLMRSATSGNKTLDALQLAVAELCAADYVITNDAAWKTFRGLNVVLVKELGTP